MTTCYVVDKLLDHPDAEEKDLPLIREASVELSYDESQFQELLTEVQAAYHANRGRRLVAAAFPEITAEKLIVPNDVGAHVTTSEGSE